MGRNGARAARLKAVLAAASIVALASAGALAAEGVTGGGDALWSRAVAIVGANDDWTPGRTVLTGRETDGAGRTRSSWEVTILARPGSSGEAEQEIVRYVENGKDVTAERRARQPERGGGQSQGGGPFSWNPSDPRQLPLHPAVQARVTVTRTADETFVQGRMCARYAFRQRLDGRSSAAGTVWIETATGVPVAMEATYDPLPPFVNRAELALGFAGGADGSWRVRSFRAAGEGTFLLIRRSFTMELDLDEHWRAPVAAR